MAALAGQRQTLRNEQLQPEVTLLLDYMEGVATVDLVAMPYHKAETFRRMRAEFVAHFRPDPPSPT